MRELMATAVGDPRFQPGMVTVVQTAGDLVGCHPLVHALASRCGWDRRGRWVPVPFVDPTAAERLFRHRMLALLSGEGLLSQERIELLLSWRHSGFSAHNAVTVGAAATPPRLSGSGVAAHGLAALGPAAPVRRCATPAGPDLLRSPVAVERLTFAAGAKQVL